MELFLPGISTGKLKSGKISLLLEDLMLQLRSLCLSYSGVTSISTGQWKTEPQYFKNMVPITEVNSIGP